MENLGFNREPFFSSRRTVLRRTKLIVDRWMERSSRWTARMTRRFVNRRDQMWNVRSSSCGFELIRDPFDGLISTVIIILMDGADHFT